MSQHYLPAIIPAKIYWQDQQPVSQQYNDIYFSKQDGLAETDYVFLQQNRLQQRWQCLQTDSFVIAETGFGTGLNFLATVKLWLQTVKDTQRLHFISVDKHPLQKVDLQKALSYWTKLSIYAEELYQYYPALTPGWHRLILWGGRVHLSLYFGDVLDFLKDAAFKADAWFLDGFAPSTNISMWSAELFTMLAKQTRPDGSFATYTAAGDVRRGLHAVGFNVQKVKGYGNKRELLYGHKALTEKSKPYSIEDAPWFIHSEIRPRTKEAVIIGAGLAGAFSAYALAERGYHVTVLESTDAIAQQASGNQQAVIYSKHSPYDSTQYRFYHQAYLFALQVLAEQQYKSCVQQTGALYLAYNEKERLRHHKAISAAVWPESLMQMVNAKQASAIAGVSVNTDALFFPQSGYVQPVALCQLLLNHTNIEVLCNSHVQSLQADDNDSWLLMNTQDQLLAKTSTVVICTAYAAQQFLQLAKLPLRQIRGQVSYLRSPVKQQTLHTILCYDGYITPAINNTYTVGASFNLNARGKTPNIKDDEENLEKLKAALPSLYNTITAGKENVISGSHVGFRCYTPDYLPLVGPVPYWSDFLNAYDHLRYGQLKKTLTATEYMPGLFVNLAHGSRGVTSAPLSAEVLAAYINNEPFPVGDAVRRAIHPARFYLRAIKTNKY